jgi:acyl-ACP thioesterase
MKNLTNLLIEMLRADPLISSAHDVIDEYFKQNVTQYIDQFEQLRAINENTPNQIVDDSIRLIGMNIPNWVMEANGNNIRQCFYHLTQFYQVSGVNAYPKFIEFLLGRGFKVSNLYTSDYVSFYTEPKGKLVHEGGTWFSTSHVDLEVYANNILNAYPLTLNDQDVVWIKKSLDYEKQPQWKKDDIDNDINLMIKNGTVYGINDAVYAYTVLDKRIIDLFYQFAPIEEVVRGIYMTIASAANLIISMSVVEEGIDFVDLSSANPLTVILELNSMLSAGKEYKYYARVIWDNESETIEPIKITWADHGYTLIDKDTIIFAEVENLIRKNVVLQYTCVGRSLSSTITVYQGGVELVPAEVLISGSNILRENSVTQFKVLGNFRGPQGDTKIREIFDVENVKFYSESEHVSVNGFQVKVNRIFEDKNIKLFAEYTTSENVIIATEYDVVLKQNLKPVLPINIIQRFFKLVIDVNGEVLGESEEFGDLVQGTTYRFLTQVLYSNNQVVDVRCDNLLSSPVITIDSSDKFLVTATGSNYSNVFTSKYVENDETLIVETKKLCMFPQIELLNLEIQGPSFIKEGEVQNYTVIAEWSSGQYSSVPAATLTSKESLLGNQLLYALDINNFGQVTAPVIGRTRPALLTAKTQRYTDGQWISTQRIIEIKNTEREPVTLDIIMSEVINEGNILPLYFYANWSDGKRTQVLPNKVVLKTDSRVLCSMIRENENSPDLFQEFKYGGLSIENDPNLVFTDFENGVECKQLNLEYSRPSSIKGLVTISFEYTDPASSVTLTYDRIFTAIAYIVTPTDIELDSPVVMGEGTRYFVRALVTYEDSSVKEVDAIWKITDTVGDTEDLDADISQGFFTLDQIVQSLIGESKENITDLALSGQNLDQFQIRSLVQGEPLFRSLQNQPILGQTWPQKLAILYAQYSEALPRCVVQTRFGDQDAKFVLNCSFYALQDQKVIDVIDKEVEPSNKILNWYITGDVEIVANLYNFYSYGLVVKYDDTGVEYLVSNDWSIELYADDTFDQRRELIRTIVMRDGDSILPMDNDGSGTRKTVDELTTEEMLNIMPTSSVVDIDQNGYLYPRINENIRAVITADYDDGEQVFSESLSIYMRKQNTRLKKIEIALIGPTGNLTYDFKTKLKDEPNEWSFVSPENVVYYQFKAFLTRMDSIDPVELSKNLFWKAEPIGTGVSFDELTGRLYVQRQFDDSDITIVAKYEEEFRESETSSTVFLEEIVARSILKIFAHKALDAIDVVGSLHTNSGTTYYPKVDVVRRDGSLAQNVLQFALVSGPNDVSLTADLLGFVIPKRTTDATMIIRALATEGSRVIKRDLEINILASFVPMDLVINSNPSGLRDNSKYFLKAFLEMRDNTVYDATQECYWLLDTNFNGLNLGNRNGILEVPYVEKDTEIVIRCIYTRNEKSFEKKHVITIQSSYPIFFSEVAQPIDDQFLQTILAGSKFLRLLSDVGGKFTCAPNANEYCYFACKKSNGIANIAIVPSSSNQVNWGGMLMPVEVTRTYLDGTAEIWNIYRNTVRGFGVAEFSVAYT